MPVYNCISPEGSLSDAVREKVATGITDAHCKSTGAPRNFVHVFFRETSSTRFDKPYFIDGVNRAGRPEGVVLALKEDLRKAYSEGAGIALDQIGARISETPASWIMEGGDILPEPGEEDEKWFSQDTNSSVNAADR